MSNLQSTELLLEIVSFIGPFFEFSLQLSNLLSLFLISLIISDHQTTVFVEISSDSMEFGGQSLSFLLKNGQKFTSFLQLKTVVLLFSFQSFNCAILNINLELEFGYFFQTLLHFKSSLIKLLGNSAWPLLNFFQLPIFDAKFSILTSNLFFILHNSCFMLSFNSF